MKVNALRRISTLVTLALAAVSQLHSQQPATPNYYQVLNYIKVPPAGRTEFEHLIKEVSVKVAEARLNAGEIVSWTLLQTVMPAGSEARADYLVSTLYDGVPPAPRDHSSYEALFKQAGVTMTLDDFYAKRRQVSSLVNTELWRPASRVGNLQKGHYLYINFMRVKDAEAYAKFEQTVWQPMAAEMVKEGNMSGWIFAAKVLPGGTDTAYSHYTADFFPTWADVFKEWSVETVFAKAHPGENIDDTMAKVATLRSLAVRELWVVAERVAK